MPLVERDESAILESVKAAPRRSSIIKVTTQVLGFCTWNTPVSCQISNLTRPCLLDIKLKSDHCGIVANLLLLDLPSLKWYIKPLDYTMMIIKIARFEHSLIINFD